MVAVGSIVRADMEFMRCGLHLVLQDQQSLGPGANDGNHMVAQLFQAAGNGV